MRVRSSSGSFSVHAIAGTYVVLLGFDLGEDDCQGLLGFSIHRTDYAENEARFMTGQKCFEATDPGFPPGAKYSTADHPYQSFQWSDYTAKPGHRYTYKVTALNGMPQHLTPFAEAAVDVDTESPAGGIHDIYFNRGVAGSQAYVERFGNRPPDEVPNNKAFEWLSRGLFEAMRGFVLEHAEPRTSFRVAAYEFHYGGFLDAIKTASQDSDIRIVFEARDPDLREKNRAAVQRAGIADLCSERQANPSYIAHNKFIVRLRDGAPEAVWTGGTNFSEGGIFGHSNVAHVVEDAAIAKAYLDYWTLLAGDPENADLKPSVEALSPLPGTARPPAGITPIFSPRANLDALNWYAELAKSAQDGLFMTFAFGMNDVFKDVYRTSQAKLRFALMEKKSRAMRKKEDMVAEEQRIDALRRLPENVFAVGSLIRTNELEGWVKERLTGLNRNVMYVHNKFMLADPLSDDPIVVAGSANFSAASTKDNDENMLAVRGDKRTADIYLGEFMRLYSHHAFRESLGFKGAIEKRKFLRTDDWWKDFYNGSSRDRRRRYFR